MDIILNYKLRIIHKKLKLKIIQDYQRSESPDLGQRNIAAGLNMFFISPPIPLANVEK